LLVAFSGNGESAMVGVGVGLVEANQFGAAQTTLVEQRQQ